VAAWLAAQLPEEVRSRVIERMTAVNGELRDLSGRKELSDIRVAQGLDGRFHRAYQEAAAGPQLLNELDALHARRERYVRIYTEALVHGHHLEDSLREHEAILSALQTGDAAQAEMHAVFNHRNALDRYHRIIDAFGERGSW
jgi:DNA-binding GntR family transcriptional regulator